MDLQILQRHFTKIGATLHVEIVSEDRRFQPRRWGVRLPSLDFVLDIVQDHRGELFSLTIRETAQANLEFASPDIRPERRHLLLVAKNLAAPPADQKQKFLCGHDERHWFVAPVPEAQSVTSVAQAMEALKPAAARLSQQRHGVKVKDWNDRRNPGFIRQGEWFFLPRPNFAPPNERMILSNEPIQRSGGKPHIVEWLYRSGGETVYVASRYPNGLTERQYRQLLQRDPRAVRLDWRVMRRNPQVYARGKIRHPDHQTLTLPFWHLVVMSGEQRSSNVVFLD